MCSDRALEAACSPSLGGGIGKNIADAQIGAVSSGYMMERTQNKHLGAQPFHSEWKAPWKVRRRAGGRGNFSLAPRTWAYNRSSEMEAAVLLLYPPTWTGFLQRLGRGKPDGRRSLGSAAQNYLGQLKCILPLLPPNLVIPDSASTASPLQ